MFSIIKLKPLPIRKLLVFGIQEKLRFRQPDCYCRRNFLLISRLRHYFEPSCPRKACKIWHCLGRYKMFFTPMVCTNDEVLHTELKKVLSQLAYSFSLKCGKNIVSSDCLGTYKERPLTWFVILKNSYFFFQNHSTK